MFGVPLTQTQNNRNQAKDRNYTLNLRLVPPGFFKVWEAPYDKEGRTTVHNTGQKAQHWTRTKGNNTNGALKKAQRQQGGGKSAPQWDVWAFLAAHGLLTTPISRIELHDTHSRGEIKRQRGSHIKVWALRPDWTWSGSMTTAKVQVFFFSSSSLKCILFVHAWYNITASNMFFIQRMVYQSDQCQW